MTKKNISNEELGGELTDYPNEKYRQFFDKFKEIETMDVSLWRPVHILAYFCKKYKEIYDLPYRFKFNSPSPAKCFEVFQIKKLAQMLSASPKILRDYIDWVYKEKAENGKRRLTSISFITQEPTVNYYKINVLLADKKELHIDRSTSVPEDYKIIFTNNNISINTYGDIAFFNNAIEAGGLQGTQAEQFKLAIQQAVEIGFDPNILKRIV